MSLTKPIKCVLSAVLRRPRASKTNTQISRSYGLACITTSLDGSYSRHKPLNRSLETLNILIRQAHSGVNANPSLYPICRGGSSVSTFNPSALQPSDYLDISHKTAVLVRRSTQDSSLSPSRLGYHLNARFPSNTKGFFYLHRPPTIYHIRYSKGSLDKEVAVAAHVAAGQLRFRILDTPDPAKFAEGSDLKAHTGCEPWGIHLVYMHGHLRYQQLYQALTSQTERDDIQTFLTRSRETAGKVAIRRGLQILSSILEPFILDFSHVGVSLCLLDTNCIVKYPLSHISVMYGLFGSPYSGKALCRFEPAKIQTKHRSKPVLTIRVLEWIKRPNPSDAFVQEEGRLVKKWNSKTGGEVPYLSKTVLPPASRELLLKAFPIPEAWPSWHRKVMRAAEQLP